MTAPVFPEVLLHSGQQSSQAALPLATEGVLRYVWRSRWGEMLIEVVEGRMFVNDQPVVLVEEAAATRASSGDLT